MFGEKGEAARDQQHLEAGLLAGLDQCLRARRELQALVAHAGHVGFGHALEQGHALAQAFLEVGDLTAHRGLGDGRDFGFLARGVGNLVDALDGDQRRVHVKGNELVVAQTQGRRGALDHQAGGKFGSGAHCGAVECRR